MRGAKTFKCRLGDDGDIHKFYIRISPFVDAKDYLANATPSFCLSMGAKVEPPMTEPQDFSDPDNPVVYTVTSGDGKHVEKYYVSWSESDLKAYGEGIGGADHIYATYVELGFPGTYGKWSQDDNLKTDYGDLMGFPAFCGPGHLVIFSRRFAWGDTGAAGAKYEMKANPSHAFKVFDVTNLRQSGTLNLGPVKPEQVVAITSDAVGHMVAAVGRRATGKTDFYYWTAPDQAPIHMGTAPVAVDISNNETDAGSYINVTGDVTVSAVISASAPRTNKGQHYKFRSFRGKLDSQYEVIETGHSALDQNQFQMISYFSTDENSPYLVGDSEPNGAEVSGQVRIYLNNPDGSNRSTCDYHATWFNGALHDDGEAWWSRSGRWLNRTGGRRPTVHAMVLNGKQYSYFTTGYDWRNRAIICNLELTEGSLEFPSWGFGLCTKSKHPEKKDGGMWIGDSMGMMADWYFNDDDKEGYIAVWSDRWGIDIFHLTCFE